MRKTTNGAIAPLVEPVAVPDVYVDGISHIEQLQGGNVRVTLYAEQTCIHTGESERIVVGKFITSAETVPGCIDQLLQCARAGPGQSTPGSRRKAVH